jgi:hypothetical protein
MVFRRGLTLKKKNKSFGMTMIMVSVIVALNLAGIGYAQWNQGMAVKSGLTTATIDAQIDSFIIDGKGLEGSKDKGNLKLKGTMQEGETATVSYSIINKGSVPLKFGEPKVTEINGLQFDLTSAVKEMDSKTGSGQFEITACEEGNYSFKVELPYSMDDQ